MSLSAYHGSTSAFVTKILREGEKIPSEVRKDLESIDEIYRIYFEKLSLFEKACLFPLSQTEKILLQNKKEELYLELNLLRLKQDMNKEFDSIHTDLEDLKKDL